MGAELFSPATGQLVRCMNVNGERRETSAKNLVTVTFDDPERPREVTFLKPDGFLPGAVDPIDAMELRASDRRVVFMGVENGAMPTRNADGAEVVKAKLWAVAPF